MRSLPAANQPIVDPDTGVLRPEWVKHFARQDAYASAILSLTLTGSPYAYTASGRGRLLVKGGTVSSISLTRARVTIITGLTAGFIPMSAGDVVTITYSALPTASFIPE